MRFTFAALLATLATTCFAHKVSTLAFPPTAPVSPGSKIVVQVVRGVSLFSPGFSSWFTKPHWHWFYRTLWHRPLSVVLRLGHAPQQIQFAFLLARLWEPFSLRGPSIRNSHDSLQPGLLSRISRSLFPRRSHRAPQSSPYSTLL